MSFGRLSLGFGLGSSNAGGGGAAVAPSGMVDNSGFLFNFKGTSSAAGTGSSDASVYGYDAQYKAISTTTANISVTGVAGGDSASVATALGTLTTTQWGGWVMGEFMGNDVASYSDYTATLTAVNSAISTAATNQDATLPRFYFVNKYNAQGEAPSALSGQLKQSVNRFIEVSYPASYIDWDWYSRNRVGLLSADVWARTFNTFQPSFAANGGTDTKHQNDNGYTTSFQGLFQHIERGAAGELPFISDGRRVFARKSSAWASGDVVQDMRVLNDLTGTTFSTTSPDFGFAVLDAHTLRITRTSATVLTAAYTLVPLTMVKTLGDGRKFTRTINLRIGLGATSAVPNINTWRGGGLITKLVGDNSGLSVTNTTDATLVYGIRLPADGSMDGKAFTLFDGPIQANVQTSGSTQFRFRRSSVWPTKTTAIQINSPVITRTANMIWVFVEGSTASAGSFGRVFVDETTGGSNPTNLGADVTLAHDRGPWNMFNNGVNDGNTGTFVGHISGTTLTIESGTPPPINSSVSIAGSGVTTTGLASGSANADGTYNVAVSQTVAGGTTMTWTVTNSMRPVPGVGIDIVGPFIFNGIVGVTDPTVGAARRAMFRNPATPNVPLDFAAAVFAATGLSPYLALTGNAADMYQGADGADGASAKNAGTGGDLLYLDRAAIQTSGLPYTDAPPPMGVVTV